MAHLGEIDLLRFLVQVGVLLVAARGLADVMKRLGQAPVVGELLAGILLGPSGLGRIAPGAFAIVFPTSPDALPLLDAFAWMGAVMLLLFVGLETDLAVLRGVGRTAAIVSAFGLVVPFGCGFALGLGLPSAYLAASESRLIFALFMAVAIAISAVPVIAKILIDLGLVRRELGVLILASGVIDDTVGWLGLSLVAGLAARGSFGWVSTGALLLETAAFVLFCYFVGYRLVRSLLRWVDDRTYAEHGKFTAMIAIAFVCAAATEAIGIHAVFGGFVAGLMLTMSARVRKPERSELEALATGFMAPVFFAFSGLKVNFAALEEPLVPLAVIAVAFVSKIVGCGLGGLVGRLEWREALAVAVGMNARGGMGIIVALVGLGLGVLTPAMYSILVLVALLTSIATPPLLTWSLRGVRKRPGDEARLERERLQERIPLARDGAKLLVLSGGGANADLATHLAAALANHHDASVTVFHADVGAAAGAGQDFNAEFARIKKIAEQSGASRVYQRLGSAESITEAVAEEVARGYDAIFAGASHLHRRHELGGEPLRALLAAARAPVVIVRNVGAPMPLRRVLVPITGAPFSRLGAAVAMLYAQAARARITALYVRERPLPTLSALALRGRREAEGDEIVGEIQSLGAELGITVEARIQSGRRPENIILRAAEEGGFELLVMGVLFRSAEQRLYFGPKVEEILRKTRCAVAVVVPPERMLAKG